MRLYYLDRELKREEVDFIGRVLKLSEPIRQIRIPYVFLVRDPNRGNCEPEFAEGGLVEKELLCAGILKDRGRKICLVAPKDNHLFQSLIPAIHRFTGHYPCLIQTEDRSEYLMNPLRIRVVDMEELIGRNNTDIQP